MTDTTSTSQPTPTPHGPSDHPGVDTWISYHAGTVSSGEQKHLQQHLASCRECLDLVLDLDRFVEPAEESDRKVSDFEQAAVWRSLQPHLAAESAPAEAPVRRSAWIAIAASVLFATFGLSQWAAQQREIASLDARITELSRPHANTVILDLTPSSRQRNARGADVRTSMLTTAGPVTLILNLATPVEYPDYRLEILDLAGTEVRQIDDLRMSEFGNFTLSLPAGSLASGDYDLQLYGIDTGAGDSPVETLLETYPISLR